MAKLLHLQSSPRKERSASIAVAEHFLEVYRARHPEDTVETLNVWEADLPEFNGETINAKYAVMHGESPTPSQLEAWRAVTRVAEHFKSADKYLFSVPMWNYSVPYKLKHYLDVLVQPGLAFTFSPETGPVGLITGKPAVGIYSAALAYGPGSGNEKLDQQSTYLRQILGYIGFTDIHDLLVEPTLGAAPTAEKDAVAAAKPQAAELASAL